MVPSTRIHPKNDDITNDIDFISNSFRFISNDRLYAKNTMDNQNLYKERIQNALNRINVISLL